MIELELKHIVLLEAACVPLVLAIILCAYKHWLKGLIVSATIAGTALFAAWSPIMAAGSVLAYTPACILLWLEVDKNTDLDHDRHKQLIRSICWGFLALGVSLLIINNTLNIYNYLH